MIERNELHPEVCIEGQIQCKQKLKLLSFQVLRDNGLQPKDNRAREQIVVKETKEVHEVLTENHILRK